MKEEIENLKKQALEELTNSKSSKELNDLRVKYLGRKGELTGLLRGMGSLSPEERPKMGALVNSAKQEIENEIQDEQNYIIQATIQMPLPDTIIDMRKYDNDGNSSVSFFYCNTFWVTCEEKRKKFRNY